MARNSKREQLLEKVVAQLKTLDSLKTVERKPLTGIKELSSIANTKLPIAIVLGKLPVPAEKEPGRSVQVDKFQSKLSIDVLVYFQDAKTPDTTTSLIADDIWAKLLSDVSQGFKWVIATSILPDANVAVWDPYAAFIMTVNITYLHGKEGI